MVRDILGLYKALGARGDIKKVKLSGDQESQKGLRINKLRDNMYSLAVAMVDLGKRLISIEEKTRSVRWLS